MDSETFRRHAHDLVDWMADYMAGVENHPVRPQVRPGSIAAQLPAEAPAKGEAFEDIFRDFQNVVMPGMTHWQHPSFFAYFPANTSPPSVLAEMLTATLGAQCMLWQTSPAATELEGRVAEWLARALASDGYLTVIPEFSIDLAVTDPDRADTLIARYGEGKKVVVAGHSLGGAMAAQYAADRERAGSGLAGLILMAAYPADSADLSGADLPVLSLLGENDQVVNRDALDAAWSRLPADTERVVIEGGVHSFFGRYGPQAGDGLPSVPRVAAETQLLQAVDDFLAGL